MQQEEEHAGREIWCVFDYDVKPDEASTQPNDFNSSITRAQDNGLKVACSNDAFERWFALHYVELHANVNRRDLYTILKDRWELDSFHNEAKAKAFCKGHYDRHQGLNGASQELAIRRARRLHEAYRGDRNYSDQCPCTTVYLLVEELNKYLK
ncbi:RloB family protein [Chitinophaga sancti]|uniref:RloB family protein n=1 Tax=Chitinophaga sancti TaxID=1004 RepID=UPI002A74C49C|nr:RloB family protein [Chitinophaga sancti]WPQ63585.1 RloB family protein [Chitinophaga sancti]